MGADVSADRGKYTAQQTADLERRYREMYGEDLSREELLERYRLEKLKADRKKRLEEANAADAAKRKNSNEDDSRRERHHSRDRHYDRSRRRHDDDRRPADSERRRHDNDHRDHRSHRSRGHRRDERTRREHRSRHRRDSSSRHRERSRSTSSSTKENHGRDRKSSRTMKSSERDRESRSGRREEKSSRSRGKDGRERSTKAEESKRSTRSRSKHTQAESDSDDTKIDRKNEAKTKSSKSKENKEKSSNTVRSKKKKNHSKPEHYKSAPDLTDDREREYGRGPWKRTHDYFDGYEQRPQSWVEEIATDRNSIMPAPVMERQIIYSMPQNAPIVDGMGYPLASIPHQSIYNQRQDRPSSFEPPVQEPEFQAREERSMRAAPTTIKIPAGAVPALGPNASISPKKASTHKQKEKRKKKSSTLPSQHGGLTSLPDYQTSPQYGQPSTLPRSDGPTPKPRIKSPMKEKSPVAIKSVQVKTLSPHRSSHGKKHKGRITSISAREDFESLLASDYGASNMMSDSFMTEDAAPSYPGNYRPNQEIFVDDVIIRNHQPLDQQARKEDESDSEGVTDEEHVLTLGRNFSPNSHSYSSGFDLEIPEVFCFDSDTSASKGSPRKKHASRKSRDKVVRKTAAKPVYGIQGKHKSNQQQPLVLTSVQPVSPHDDDGKNYSDRRSTNRRSTSKEQQLSSQVRASTSPGRTGRKQRYSSSPERYAEKLNANQNPRQKLHKRDQSSQQHRHDTGARESQIHPTSAALERLSNDQKSGEKRISKRVQHPSQNGQAEKVVFPSKTGWSPEKKTHDVGVGTIACKPHLKSTAVQTPRKKQAPAEPLYFLKPISSHEVFIEDSSIASRSATDMSLARTTSVTSGPSEDRTASWSRSSSVTLDTEYTQQSEAESVIPFQRNSTSHYGLNNHPPPLSSRSFDPEPVRVVQPAMKISISESIQAAKYTGHGGKVFYISRSRHGSSPPPSLKALSEDAKSIDERKQDPPQHWHQEAERQNNQEFDAHEVGMWVLDCYAQDQKLKSINAQSEPMLIRNSAVVKQTQLPKQSSASYEASFTLRSEFEQSHGDDQVAKVIPLTQQALKNHDGNISRHSSQNERLSVELSGNGNGKASQDQRMLQQELTITKNKIRVNPERKRTPEPEWKSEQYQAKLNHWNTSRSANVVLAEVGSVNDTDDTDSTLSKQSSTHEVVSIPPVQVQIPITKNTRVIQPRNQRPSYVEQPVQQPQDAHVRHLTSQQREALKWNGGSQTSSTETEHAHSVSELPATHHSKSTVKSREPFVKSKTTAQNGDDSLHPVPSSLKNSAQSMYSRSRATEADESVVETKVQSQQEAKPAWTINQRRNSLQQYEDLVNKRNEHQQQYVPEWARKTTAARSHNRQPYLEKIAKASETSSTRPPYRGNYPKGNRAAAEPIDFSPNPATSESIKHEDHHIAEMNSEYENKRRSETKPIESVHVPAQKSPNVISRQRVSSDSESETTLSSDSSEEMISPKRTLREALRTRGPYKIEPNVQPPSKPLNGNIKAPMQNAPVNKNPTPGPRRSISVGCESTNPPAVEAWRIVGQREKNNPAITNVTQRNPTVPRAQMREKSASISVNPPPSKTNAVLTPTATVNESNLQTASASPRRQQRNLSDERQTQKMISSPSNSTVQPYPRESLIHQQTSKDISQSAAHSVTKSTEDDTASSSDQLDNPFNTMDEAEISSIVDKIPGRTTMTRSGSESDIMEKLEKSRNDIKTETLEERTARILGIHRRTSEDSSSDETRKPEKSGILKNSSASSSEPKKDLNTYMNDLLTGATAVSPGTRQKYLSNDSSKVHGTSPLVKNSVSSRNCETLNKKNVNTAKILQRQSPLEESDDGDGSSSDKADAIVDYGLPSQSTNVQPTKSNTGYRQNDRISANDRVSPVSPHGKMLLSYGNNIYAETPGFHKQQHSYGSTESDDNDDMDEKNEASAMPVARNMENHSSAASHSSSEDLSGSQNHDSGPVRHDTTGLSVWSHRDVAKDKIAKSIGFTLKHASDSTVQGTTPNIINSDEYDIKILTFNGKKNDGEGVPTNGKAVNSEDSASSVGEDGSLEEVMQSIGLDPSEAWTMSV